MHYFKRNIGDYAKKAGRLSMLQHGAYTLLLDSCYDREKFPTLEEAIEWTWASTTEEVEAITFILRKFFTVEDGVYVQKRIQEEIAEYHAKADINKRIAIDREAKRREKSTNRALDSTNRDRSVIDSSPGEHASTPKQEPLTTNQEPTETHGATSAPKSPRKRAAKSNPDLLDAERLIADGVDGQVARDWLAIRKEKKLPLTVTAWDDTKDEGAKASMTPGEAVKYAVVRGRAGFKAAWVATDAQGNGAPQKLGKPGGMHTGFDKIDYGKSGRL